MMGLFRLGGEPLDLSYSVRVYKQYFNFSCAHFLVFDDGSREPLHGHNYRVEVQGKSPIGQSDMVFDFLDIKPIVREVCDSLDHRYLLPMDNPHLKIEETESQIEVRTKDAFFSFPRQDVLLIPLTNTSAERIAQYIWNQVQDILKERHQFIFKHLKVEVEETPGQSAIYSSQQEERSFDF